METLGMNGEVQGKPAASAHVFECKTCDRQFSSFQALGGHRASHRKPKHLNHHHGSLPYPDSKPRTHTCSICGHVFSLGQALGGHMRRHQGIAKEDHDHVEKKSRGDGDHHKRMLGLDLNMTPPMAMDNDSEVRLLTFTLGLPVV